MAMSEAKLSALLECKICMDTYEQPKQLNCGHTYCKNCLDNILSFKEDGSAEIRCPLKCKGAMAIGNDETTSSLSTNYPLSHIIDELESNKQISSNQICQELENCKRDILLQCSTCGTVICRQCKEVHTCNAKSFTTVSFNKKLAEIQALCGQHNNLAKQVCLDCGNIFACIYCVHREHLHHRRKTIAEFGVEAKTWFQSFIDNLKDTETSLENLTENYNAAFLNIKIEREKLVRELEVRKLKRVDQYIAMLNAEGDNLLTQFDEKAKEFKTTVIEAGYSDNNKIKQASEYINVFNCKANFELVAQKIEIERQLRDLTSVPTTVPCFNFHLRNLNEQDLLVNSLGEMAVSVRNISTVSAGTDKNAVFERCINETKMQCIPPDLKQNMMDLIECLNRKEEQVDKREAAFRTLSDVKPKVMLVVKKSYSFDDLVEIIKKGDEEKMQLILMGNANIVKMRGNMEATLLMEAAYYNEPSIVKSLIDAGSDVNAVDEYKNNAYHYSAINGHYDVLNALINHDVTSINNVGYENNTPLHNVSRHGHIECVKLLLSIPHIDVNIQNNDNETAYDVAMNGDIKRLLQQH